MSSKTSNWNESFDRGENNILYPQSEVVRFINRFIRKKINYHGEYQEVLYPENNKKKIIGLDFGCGVGRHAILFEEFDIEAHGVDISSVAIDKAKQNAAFFGFKGLRDRFLVLNDTNLPFENNSFNFSVAESCLDSMTFQNARAYLQELIRISSDYVYVSLISFDEMNPVGETVIDTDHEKGTIQYFYDESKISELIKDIKCEIIYFKKISEVSEYDDASESRFFIVLKNK